MRRGKVHKIIAALTKENAATFPSRHLFTYFAGLRSESVVVTPQEARTINLSGVTEAGFLIVVRPLRIVGTTMLSIALARLQPILISLPRRLLRIVEDVMTVTAVIVEVRIIAPSTSPEWSIDRPANDNHASLLCRGRRAGERNNDSREQQSGQNQAANLAKIFSNHDKKPSLFSY